MPYSSWGNFPALQRTSAQISFTSAFLPFTPVVFLSSFKLLSFTFISLPFPQTFIFGLICAPLSRSFRYLRLFDKPRVNLSWWTVWIKERSEKRALFCRRHLPSDASVHRPWPKGPSTKTNTRTNKLIEMTLRQRWLSLLMVSNQHVCHSKPRWRCAVLCVSVHLFALFVWKHVTDLLHISVWKTGIIQAHVGYCVLYQADKPIGAQPLILILPHCPLPPSLPWLSFNGRIHSVMTWKSSGRLQPGYIEGIY